MNYSFFNRSNSRIGLAITIIAAAFIIHSCKKDVANKRPTMVDPNLVSMAKQWYNAKYPAITTGKQVLQSIGNQDWSKTFSPYWDNANTFMVDGLSFIELPALKKGDMAMSYRNTDPKSFNFSKSGSLTSLIIVNKSGNFYIYAMTILADSLYLQGNYAKLSNNNYRKRDKDFSGRVFYNRLDGSFVNGWQYQNGLITGVVTENASVNNANTPVAQNTGKLHVDVAQQQCSTTVVTTYWQQCSYYNNDEYYQHPFNCFNYTTQESYQTCTPPTNNGGSSAAPGPCTPPPADTAKVVDATRYKIIDVATDPGSNGSNPGGIVDQSNQIGVNQCATTPQPPDTTKKVDPCKLKHHIDSLITNAKIKAQNAQIAKKSTVYEYGASQNLTSWPGNTYLTTPVTTQNLPNQFTPTFSWDKSGGFTTGFSHGHPGGNGPDFYDVMPMIGNLNNSSLQAAGANAVQYYKNNVSSTILTYNGNLVITINDWATLQAVYANYLTVGPKVFTNNFLKYTQEYQIRDNSATPFEAAEYALLKIFGGAIIYTREMLDPTISNC